MKEVTYDIQALYKFLLPQEKIVYFNVF